MTSMRVPTTGTGQAARVRRERRGPTVLSAPFHPRTWRARAGRVATLVERLARGETPHPQ